MSRVETPYDSIELPAPSRQMSQREFMEEARKKGKSLLTLREIEELLISNYDFLQHRICIYTGTTVRLDEGKKGVIIVEEKERRKRAELICPEPGFFSLDSNLKLGLPEVTKPTFNELLKELGFSELAHVEEYAQAAKEHCIMYFSGFGIRHPYGEERAVSLRYNSKGWFEVNMDKTVEDRLPCSAVLCRF
ncbi:MAG: hypothetical protein J7K72_03430 [Candidatus Aenigmarchaeota archaeon]|nr:hypothetical protein [Candidatus Aenigmarchaeota archaeon]